MLTGEVAEEKKAKRSIYSEIRMDFGGSDPCCYLAR